jgi:hypothetical protein
LKATIQIRITVGLGRSLNSLRIPTTKIQFNRSYDGARFEQLPPSRQNPFALARKLFEYAENRLYFELNPLVAPAALLFIWRPPWRPKACRAHILDELTGIKTMLENRDYDPEDVCYPFDDKALLARAKKYQSL